MDLTKKLIDLGQTEEELRPHLKVVLDRLKSLEDVQTDPVLTPPPSTLIQAPAASPPESMPELPVEEASNGKFFALSPAAFRAFNTVILPQIQAQLDSLNFQDITQMISEMEGLGRSKNIDLENALIVYKPISMSAKRFFQEIQSVFHNWLRPKLKKEDSSL